jgi:hypothetical protein
MGVEIMEVLNADKCYRLTLVLDTSEASIRGDVPVQVVVQSVLQNAYCTAQVSYHQAALLIVMAFHNVPVILEHMNAVLKYKAVELLGPRDEPCLFSAHELSDVGITLDLKQAS